MDKEDNTKVITDAVLIGAMNVVVLYITQRIYPNNFMLQAFVSTSLIHISMKMLE